MRKKIPPLTVVKKQQIAVLQGPTSWLEPVPWFLIFTLFLQNKQKRYNMLICDLEGCWQADFFVPLGKAQLAVVYVHVYAEPS